MMATRYKINHHLFDVQFIKAYTCPDAGSPFANSNLCCGRRNGQLHPCRGSAASDATGGVDPVAAARRHRWPAAVRTARARYAADRAGQEVLRTARALDDVWNRFASAIDELKGLKRGRLRVALVTTAKYFLPRMLGAFAGAIRRSISNWRSPTASGSSRACAATGGRPVRDVVPAGKHRHRDPPFLDNEFVVCSAAHAPRRRQATDTAELAGEPFLLRELGSGSRQPRTRRRTACS